VNMKNFYLLVCIFIISILWAGAKPPKVLNACNDDEGFDITKETAVHHSTGVGLTKKVFVKARPCWAERRQKEQNVTLVLHKMVDVSEFERAVLCITASSNYKLYLNGEFMGFGPSIAAHGYFRIDEYDLSGKLLRGRNVLAIIATGYNTDSYYIPNQSSFVQAELLVDEEVFAATLTGKAEKAFDMAIPGQREQDVPKYTKQRTYMESYILEPSYDSWITKETFEFENIIVEEADRKNLLPRRVKYPDYSIKKSRRNESTGIFEFEKNFTGFIRTKISVKRPSKITFFWDEILEGDTITSKRKPFARMRYSLEPGDYSLESYEPYTMKYLSFLVEEGDCEVKEVSIRQYVNSDVSRAEFMTDDRALNQIFEAAVETYKQNALDVFMDCPSRERAGWLCDSYFTARVAYNLSGNTLIEHNFLENFLLPPKFKNIPEGMLPMCYPSDQSNGNFIPNWAMWFVLQLDEYVDRSGDYEMMINLKPKVLALMDYFKRFENEYGLLENLEKWVFIEWSEANKFVQDVNYPSNMLYSQVLEVVGRLYNLPSYTERSDALKEIILEQSFNEGFFSDNALRENGKLLVQDNKTEICQYFAFYFDIVTAESHPELWQRLVNDFGPQRNEKKLWPEVYPANAFIGNYMRLELLSEQELTRQLADECKKLFLYMAERTGTLWENIRPGTSCCHGFASHVAHVFYRNIAGLAKIDGVNRKIMIKFNESGLNRCEATVPIGNELISLNWIKEGKKLVYELRLPDNYTVEIQNNTEYKLVKVND
jgi:alpha-L-rhamnosidase